MSEFDRLRALLDNVAVGDSAAPAAPARGSRRWTRALWTVLAIVTALDALYLLVRALPFR